MRKTDLTLFWEFFIFLDTYDFVNIFKIYLQQILEK